MSLPSLYLINFKPITMIKTKVTKTITNEYRVIWTNLTKWQGGYEDFPTEYQAMRFINRLKYES